MVMGLGGQMNYHSVHELARSAVVPGIAACGTLGKLHHASGPLFPDTVRRGNASFPDSLVPSTVTLRTRCEGGRESRSVG